MTRILAQQNGLSELNIKLITAKNHLPGQKASGSTIISIADKT